jgi:hypothetical protein
LRRIYPASVGFPDLVLKVIPKLMNSMIVSLMKDEDTVSMQLSEKALLGF